MLHTSAIFLAAGLAFAACSDRSRPVPSVNTPQGDELAKQCANRFPPKPGWVVGAAPDLTTNWPPPPPHSALCGSEHDSDHPRAVWAWYLTERSQQQVIAYYQQALLDRRYTVSEVSEDDGGPGLEFGDVINGGGMLIVTPRGSYSVRWERRSDVRR